MHQNRTIKAGFGTLLFTTMLFAAATASAASVYKCKGKDGEVSFSNTPCPEAPAAAPHATYTPEPERKPREAEPSFDEALPFDRNAPIATGEVPDHPANTPLPSIVSSPQADVRGYTCSVDGRIWVQSTPCPATATVNRYKPVTSHMPVTGEPIHGLATIEETRGVEQRALSRSELCEQLRRNAATSRDEARASDSAYERNKLRQANGC